MNEHLPQAQSRSTATFWSRVPIVLRAIVEGFLVFAVVGSVVWTAMVVAVPAPWSLVLMAGVLWAYVRFFSGQWLAQGSKEARATRFRRTSLSPAVWKWSMVAAVAAVVVLQAGLHLTFRVVPFPADDWTLAFDFEALPRWLAWAFIVMASAVAGITEEVGFRGYMQVPLEKRYGKSAAIAIVALMFVVLHLNQAWVAAPIFIVLFVMGAIWGLLASAAGSLIPAIVSHILADIVNFSYWWSDIAGAFRNRPLSDTGIDGHFIISVTLLTLSFWIFFLAIGRTRIAQAADSE